MGRDYTSLPNENQEGIPIDMSDQIELDKPEAGVIVLNIEDSEPPPQPQKITKLPLKETMCLCAIQLNEALQINVLFPFLVFMVESFGYDGNSLGLHAGILASCFCGAQFFSSVLWGKLSDRIGLKPCLIIGLLGSVFAFLLFGFSTTFSQAIFGRALAGILNGNIGVMKSFIAKITDDTNRAQGFAILGIAWGVGTCIAPVLGGMLVSPAETWPGTFKNTVFDSHPFAFPCVVVSLWGFFTSITLVFVLEEPPNTIELALVKSQPSQLRNGQQSTEVESMYNGAIDNGGSGEREGVSEDDIGEEVSDDLSMMGHYSRLDMKKKEKQMKIKHSDENSAQRLIERLRAKIKKNKSKVKYNTLSSSEDGDNTLDEEVLEFGQQNGETKIASNEKEQNESEGESIFAQGTKEENGESLILGRGERGNIEMMMVSKEPQVVSRRDGTLDEDVNNVVSPRARNHDKVLYSSHQNRTGRVTGTPSSVATVSPFHDPFRDDANESNQSIDDHNDLSASDTEIGLKIRKNGEKFKKKGGALNNAYNRLIANASKRTSGCSSGSAHGGYSHVNSHFDSDEEEEQEGRTTDDSGKNTSSGNKSIQTSSNNTMSTSSSLTKQSKSEFSIRDTYSLGACLAYGCLAMTQQMFDEALPLFMKLSEEEHGFEFTEQQIGGVLATGGVSIIVLSFYIVPIYERIYGAVNIYRWGMIVLLPIVTTFWLYGYVWSQLNQWVGYILLTLVIILKNTCLSFSFSGVAIMICNSAPKEQLGYVNGIGQTFGSFARTIGPFLCGFLWSVGTTINFIALPFIASGVMSLVSVGIGMYLPQKLGKSYEKE